MFNDYTGIGRTFQNAGSYLKNIFKGAQSSMPQAKPSPSPTPSWAVPGYNYNPYQIKTGDTFESIASANSLSVPDLQSANGGMVVPPPKGSYINLPAAPTPNNYNVDMRGRGYTPQTQFPGSFVSPSGALNVTQLSASIQQQVAGGQMPATVSFYTPIINPTTGKPVTDQEMISNGYTYDNIRKEWRLAGSAAPGGTTAPSGNGPQSGNNWMTNPALHIVTWNKNAKNKHSTFQTTEKWARNAMKRKKRAGGGPQQVAEVVPGNAGGTPSTVLNLHLGGG